MRLRVISVGRERSGLFQPAVDEYAGRLRRYLPTELVEVPASREREPNKARVQEAERILKVHGTGPVLVLLDAGGKALDSPGLARFVGGHMSHARDLDLVIGGDEGLDASLRARAAHVLSLGPLTLPHRLARVVLLEQLYRALTILRGEPYHK